MVREDRLTVEAEDVFLSILDLYSVHCRQVVQPDESQGQVITVHQGCEGGRRERGNRGRGRWKEGEGEKREERRGR